MMRLSNVQFQVAIDLLPPDERRLVLLAVKVWDQDDRTEIYIKHFCTMNRREEVLKWLVRNKLTGKALVEWVAGECEGSILYAMQALMARVERDTIRPLFVGKDVQ